MSQLATALHIARADFRERVRRYTFLGTLGFATYLAILAGRGGIFIQLGNWRGRYSSAWMGMLLSMICTIFVSLAGFYMVSSSVKRDEQTRVGQVLAATPMSRAAYTLGKALSNFAVLASMVGVLMLAAIPLQLFKGEDKHIDVVQLMLPFVAFALPLMALIAGIAVLFEVTPLLRSSLGSAAFFFLWTAGIVACEDLNNFELFGIATYLRQIGGTIRTFDASYTKGFSIDFPIGDRPPLQLFTWTHADFPASLWGGRVVILLIALALAVLCALWFHRFDPAKVRGRGLFNPLSLLRTKKPAISEADAVPLSAATYLTPIVMRYGTVTSFLELFRGELRLLVARRHWIVYLLELA